VRHRYPGTIAHAERSASGRSGIPFRIGVHLGKVTEEEGNFLGDGVRVAAMLGRDGGAGESAFPEALSPGEGRVKAEYESLGEHRVQDIAEPVRALSPF